MKDSASLRTIGTSVSFSALVRPMRNDTPGQAVDHRKTPAAGPFEPVVGAGEVMPPGPITVG
jgi:hypothetical protein